MSSSSFRVPQPWLPLPPGLCLQLTLFVVAPDRNGWIDFFPPKLNEKPGCGPWQNVNPHPMLCRTWQGCTLVGCRTFRTHCRQSEVRLQVGACTINRVLIKAAALLSESEAPVKRCWATVAASWLYFTCSGTKPKWVSAETPVLSRLFLANMAAVKNVYWEASGSAVWPGDENERASPTNTATEKKKI